MTRNQNKSSASFAEGVYLADSAMSAAWYLLCNLQIGSHFGNASFRRMFFADDGAWTGNIYAWHTADCMHLWHHSEEYDYFSFGAQQMG